VNKGILQLALSGTVELELEYREPSGKELEAEQELLGPAPRFNRDQQQAQIQEEFARLLHAI
jgi:hypothetical protein